MKRTTERKRKDPIGIIRTDRMADGWTERRNTDRKIDWFKTNLL